MVQWRYSVDLRLANYLKEQQIVSVQPKIANTIKYLSQTKANS